MLFRSAAFYAWLDTVGDRWRDLVSVGDLILVCDIGGGTTDFSLIAVSESDGDLALTMATMTDDPHLINLPTAHGGMGRDAVHAFYRDHLVGKFFPPDVEMTSISRTIDAGSWAACTQSILGRRFTALV